MIKTTYLQALHYLNLSVEQNELLGVSAGSSISIGSSLSFYDIFNFKDPMVLLQEDLLPQLVILKKWKDF